MLVIILLSLFLNVFWVAALLIMAIGLIGIALGAFNIQWNFFVKAIHNGQTHSRQIALTFDDGPHPVYTPRVLDLLDKYAVKATFFCIGRQVTQHPEVALELHKRGHLIGNHSYTHAPTIDFHTKVKWLGEIHRTDAAIAACIGHKPCFFRPPYGVTTPHLAGAIRVSGHSVIGWRVRPYDTARRTPDRIVRTILNKTKPGDIILLHDTHDRIVPVLEQLLPALKRRNFTMVTVETLTQRHAYA
ncbi:polysaccharide deacetylase family protein [Parapedobacter sp. ISTM3]|uniref:polysaccharide deacetylase family protein n=1 Tax=Parapedobacter sp. ISTM3 TaxID=2800130 RepID=UPI001F22F0E3|nr:polysaccharide deacetylase family protein [Parapedobacter sp. ISTM3]